MEVLNVVVRTDVAQLELFCLRPAILFDLVLAETKLGIKEIYGRLVNVPPINLPASLEVNNR